MQGTAGHDCPWFPGWVRKESGQRSRTKSGCWRDHLCAGGMDKIHGSSSIVLEWRTVSRTQDLQGMGEVTKVCWPL